MLWNVSYSSLIWGVSGFKKSCNWFSSHPNTIISSMNTWIVIHHSSVINRIRFVCQNKDHNVFFSIVLFFIWKFLLCSIFESHYFIHSSFPSHLNVSPTSKKSFWYILFSLWRHFSLNITPNWMERKTNWNTTAGFWPGFEQGDWVLNQLLNP